MCHWGTDKHIELNGRIMPVDACIADTVQMLYSRAILTLASCCGHGDFDGNIVIKPEDMGAVQTLGFKTKYLETKNCFGEEVQVGLLLIDPTYDDDENY